MLRAPSELFCLRRKPKLDRRSAFRVGDVGRGSEGIGGGGGTFVILLSLTVPGSCAGSVIFDLEGAPGVDRPGLEGATMEGGVAANCRKQQSR
jgi:hypothetical protein